MHYIPTAQHLASLNHALRHLSRTWRPYTVPLSRLSFRFLGCWTATCQSEKSILFDTNLFAFLAHTTSAHRHDNYNHPNDLHGPHSTYHSICQPLGFLGQLLYPIHHEQRCPDWSRALVRLPQLLQHYLRWSPQHRHSASPGRTKDGWHILVLLQA